MGRFGKAQRAQSLGRCGEVRHLSRLLARMSLGCRVLTDVALSLAVSSAPVVPADGEDDDVESGPTRADGYAPLPTDGVRAASPASHLPRR
jgi:hypothetical protein